MREALGLLESSTEQAAARSLEVHEPAQRRLAQVGRQALVGLQAAVGLGDIGGFHRHPEAEGKGAAAGGVVAKLVG